jgi:hypothetical protein
VSADDTITIRSYRLAFDLERRLFKVDRWRLPLAYGIALRSIGYGAGALAGAVALTRVPVAGVLLAAIPAPVRFVVLPLAAAYALTRVDLDGRSAHRAGLAWLRHLATPRRIVAFRRREPSRRAIFGDLTLAPDERGARYRRAQVRGPAVVVLRYPVRARARGATLRLEQTSTLPMRRGKEVALRAGQRVVFR